MLAIQDGEIAGDLEEVSEEEAAKFAARKAETTPKA
jgi:hypothetical protein